MGNQCCKKPDDFEQYAFKDFWNIKLRMRMQNDLIDTVKNNNIKEDSEVNLRIVKKIIKEFLIPLNTKKEGLYELFWIQIFSVATGVDNKLYELIMSLLFLCIRDEIVLVKNIKEINELFPEASKTKKISDILMYYFNLLTNYCIPEIGKIYDFGKEQEENLYTIYDSRVIDSYIKDILKFDENRALNFQCWASIYKIISNDVVLRDNLNLAYKKIEENTSIDSTQKRAF